MKKESENILLPCPFCGMQKGALKELLRFLLEAKSGNLLKETICNH